MQIKLQCPVPILNEPLLIHLIVFVLHIFFLSTSTVQPNKNDMIITGVDGDLTEGDVVRVSCTVNRLYPEIASGGSFSITWGENTNSRYEKHDPVGADKAFKYTVTMTKTLNSSDNGTIVECDLQPEIGTAVHQERTVIVNCKYKLLQNVTSSHKMQVAYRVYMHQ